MEVVPGDKILEIGTGSGFQAAILSLLGANVNTLERHYELYRKAELLLKSIGISGVRCFFTDGNEGLEKYAPFDKILFTCGAEKIPQELLIQLKVGGTLVIPVGIEEQRMLRIKKISY